MIREDKLNHSYSESPIEKYFPELHDIQGIAIWINIYYYDNYNWYDICETNLYALHYNN